MSQESNTQQQQQQSAVQPPLKQQQQQFTQFQPSNLNNQVNNPNSAPIQLPANKNFQINTNLNNNSQAMPKVNEEETSNLKLLQQQQIFVNQGILPQPQTQPQPPPQIQVQQQPQQSQQLQIPQNSNPPQDNSKTSEQLVTKLATSPTNTVSTFDSPSSTQTGPFTKTLSPTSSIASTPSIINVMSNATIATTSIAPGKDYESDDDNEEVEVSPDQRWSKRNEQVTQRDVPGIDQAFLAMDTEGGIEVVWNEIILSGGKKIRTHQDEVISPFDKSSLISQFNLQRNEIN